MSNYSDDELRLVVDAVNRAGSQRKAAKELGLSRRALQRRLYVAREDQSVLTRASTEAGFNPDDANAYWVKTEHGSFYVRQDLSVDYEKLREQFLREAAEYAPKYQWALNKDYAKGCEYLLVIDAADTHFGKLSLQDETGFEYNLEETTRRFREGVLALANKSSVFGIDKIVFVLGNDVLHIDTPDKRTTSGTPQDVSGVLWQMFTVAKQAYIAAIEELAQIAPVHLVHVPSNHDWKSGWMLSDSICSWFHNHPNVVTADGSMTISHRKYMQYGVNLNMFTHGDGAKEGDLAQLMQYEAREAWGKTKYATCFTHHTHHKNRVAYGKNRGKIEKDHIGVTVLNSRHIEPENNVFVETVRSISPPDGWHHRNGYVNEQAMECFLQHVERGPEVRFTHYF